MLARRPSPSPRRCTSQRTDVIVGLLVVILLALVGLIISSALIVAAVRL